jgi:RNA polymerase sigma-70 factor (ECF subfamily)
MQVEWHVDRILIERARRGDRDAYEAIVVASSDRLYAVALRTLRDADAAGEALQAALVRIWQDLPTLRDPDRFDGWSYRVLVNCCRMQRRASRRIEARVEQADSVGSVGDSQIEIAARDELDHAFRVLPMDQRLTMVLHYYRDLSVSQIAEMLAISEGTVKSRLHAGRRAMRAVLDADARVGIGREESA